MYARGPCTPCITKSSQCTASSGGSNWHVQPCPVPGPRSQATAHSKFGEKKAITPQLSQPACQECVGSACKRSRVQRPAALASPQHQSIHRDPVHKFLHIPIAVLDDPKEQARNHLDVVMLSMLSLKRQEWTEVIHARIPSPEVLLPPLSQHQRDPHDPGTQTATPA